MLSEKENVLGIISGFNVSQWDSIVPQSPEHVQCTGHGGVSLVVSMIRGHGWHLV